MSKGNLVFRIVVGGYLAYLGFIQLLAESLNKKPENYIWFAASGVVFGVVGLFWALRAAKMLVGMKDEDEDAEDTGEEIENIEEDTITEESGEEPLIKEQETE